MQAQGVGCAAVFNGTTQEVYTYADVTRLLFREPAQELGHNTISVPVFASFADHACMESFC